MDQDDCSREKKANLNGLLITKVLEENPFAYSELDKFVELDHTKGMSCFLSAILYTGIRSNGSQYQETSDGIFIEFYGHLKFAALRFDNLHIKLSLRHSRCYNEETRGSKLRAVAEFKGSYQRMDATSPKLGMFKIHPDSVIKLHIGKEKSSASWGYFSAMVNVLGFQNRVNVNISQDSLIFRSEGKIHGLFDASATFRSDLTLWKDQRFTTEGMFEISKNNDNLDSLLEKEFKRYGKELFRKVQTRLDISLYTEHRAKSRLRDVKILHEKSIIQMAEITEEYRKVEKSLDLAKKYLKHLLQLAEDYSHEIKQLNQELNELCVLKQCPEICQEGRVCETCWEYVIGKKMGTCSATCHETEQKRIPPLTQNAICKNEYCKRIHAVHSFLGDLLGLVVGIGGIALGLPPTLSFGLGRGVSQLTRGFKQGKLDIGALKSVVTTGLSAAGAPKFIRGFAETSGKILEGDRNILSIASGYADALSLREHIPKEVKDVHQKIQNVGEDFVSSVEGEILSPLKDGISTFKEKISPPINEVQRKIQHFRKDLISSVEDEILSPVKDGISTFKEELSSPIKDVQREIQHFKKDAVSSVEDEILSPLEDGISSLKEEVSSPIKDVQRKIQDIRKDVVSSVEGEILSPLKDQIPTLKEEISSPVKGVQRKIQHIKKDAVSSVENKTLSPLEDRISSLKVEISSPIDDVQGKVQQIKKDAVPSLEEGENLSPLKDRISSSKEKILSSINEEKREKILPPVNHFNSHKKKISSPVSEQMLSFQEETLKPYREGMLQLKKRKEENPLPRSKRQILSPIKQRALQGFREEIISPVKHYLSSSKKEAFSRLKGPIVSLQRGASSLKEEVLSPVKKKLSYFSDITGKISSIKRDPLAPVKQHIIPLKKKAVSHVKQQLSSLKTQAFSWGKDQLSNLSPVFSEAANIASKAIPIVGGIASLIDRSKGHWECKFKEEKCTKGRFEYKYIHHPYNCDLPCVKRHVKKSIQKSCCSIVPCSSVAFDFSCVTENALCKRAREKALEQISNVKANAVNIFLSLQNASKNLSYWKMRKEVMSNKLRSASRSVNAYRDAVKSLEKAFNVTVENRKRKWRNLAKPLILKHFLNKHGELGIKIDGINFQVRVSPEHNVTLLPINITVSLNGTQQKQVYTVLDFTNLNRSLRSITKEILSVYVGDVSRISRRKRSAENKNVSMDDPKYYRLQTFRRLCSQFNNHKQTLHDIAMSLYKLSLENQRLHEEEILGEQSLIINNSVIFEKFKVNQTKALELGLVINYNSYSNVLANDPELSEAKRFRRETYNREFDVVHLSSKLLYKNWLATMENIFETFSEQCSGFDDCLRYTIDSLLEINFETSIFNEDKLRREIKYVEKLFVNLTQQSDMSVNTAVTVSWDILQVLQNMTGVENVCSQAPNITEHPTPFIELGVNETLVLSCNATGDSLVFQWKFNAENLENQSNNILRINNVSSLHSGNYSCEVFNHVARASSIPAVVVVGTPPLIVSHPVHWLNVILSGYGNLHCQVKKDTHNISYQWWFNSFDSGSFMPLPNETFSFLSFAPVKSFHEGWYFCNVSNPFGNAISQKSFVKVLKYSLPVPVAKLSLTVISKSFGHVLVFYKDALAKILASRLVTSHNDTQPSEKLIKELIPTSCKEISQGADGFSRTETCDWTFSVIGENVTLRAFDSAPSQQINEIIRSTFKLKRVIGNLGNDTNAGNIAFSVNNSNFFSPRNSLGIVGMSLICPRGQFFVENVYKCGKFSNGVLHLNGGKLITTFRSMFFFNLQLRNVCSKCSTIASKIIIRVIN